MSELSLHIHAITNLIFQIESYRFSFHAVSYTHLDVYKRQEHTLLETLARNAGKIVTVDALCEALWGDNPFGYENSLNAHVRRVREKIETDPSKPVSLITIKGLGYKLIARK